MYLNKAMIYGNLTRDPEMKALPSGMQVCSFSLATNRVYNDRDGKRQESVDYHNIAVFGKQAENCAKYLTKGSATYVEGRLRTRPTNAVNSLKRSPCSSSRFSTLAA